jgi:hypothetical protein
LGNGGLSGTTAWPDPLPSEHILGGFSPGEETDLDNADDDQDCVDGARSFFAVYNAHDVNKMVAACSEDAEFRYVLLGNKGEGKARELGKSIWTGLFDAFPGVAGIAGRR